MIGIKVQNLIWQKALLDLLKGNAEKFVPTHTYAALLTDNQMDTFNVPILILGKDIDLPCSAKKLKEKLIQMSLGNFENQYFKWEPRTRQLIQKASLKIIQLTEKESAIIGFLAKKYDHQATKGEILDTVWHYQQDVHTHTLESHIYTLRQKLSPYDDKLIILESGKYKLI